MCRKNVLTIVAMAMFALAATANAELINVNIDIEERTESTLDGPFDGTGGNDVGTTWNQSLGQTISGTDLLNSTGAATTVDFTCDVGRVNEWLNGAELEMLLAACHNWVPTEPYTLTISDLTAGTKYNLYLASFHPNENGNRALFSTANTTDTASPQIVDSGGGGGNDDTWVEGVNYALFENVEPDGSGEIIITVVGDWTDNTKRAYLSGFQLMSGSLMWTNPPDGGTVPTTFNPLEWELPDPNDTVGGTVTCDVWFSTNYPNYGLDPNNPDFTDFATQIVGQTSGPEAVESVSIPIELALVPLHTYYWRIDMYDDSMPEPPAQPSISQVFMFNTNNTAPQVDAGEAEPTWLVEGTVNFDLLGELTDDDGLPVAATLLWTADPNLTIITDPTQLGITVTTTKTGTFELTLTADDTDLTGFDTVSILIYANWCEAAKGEEGATMHLTDLNEDCTTDVLDLAIFAREWLLRIDESL